MSNMQADSRISELEQKVSAMSKALDLLLFEEQENMTTEEVKELKGTMEDYLEGKKDAFVSLDDLKRCSK
jgi:ElaB/YqjD/DUF883 family membrane-anchored ribosome-binding protein